ncbi:MAG TPA: NUDIX hydrolase [Vicinamibacteria bacterium]|nr:NUDIX hydrolase [Vicinamibacteria bacterium]
MGVGAVVMVGDRVLLVRRGKEPLRGRWVIPGGTVELGETLHEALVREVAEETGVVVVPREVVLVFDRIERDGAGVRYHYVVIDYRCEYVSGEPRAGSDAADVALVGPDDLDAYDLPPQALALVLDVFRRRV